jgi:hypothetical protein
MMQQQTIPRIRMSFTEGPANQDFSMYNVQKLLVNDTSSTPPPAPVALPVDVKYELTENSIKKLKDNDLDVNNVISEYKVDTEEDRAIAFYDNKVVPILKVYNEYYDDLREAIQNEAKIKQVLNKHPNTEKIKEKLIDSIRGEWEANKKLMDDYAEQIAANLSSDDNEVYTLYYLGDETVDEDEIKQNIAFIDKLLETNSTLMLLFEVYEILRDQEGKLKRGDNSGLFDMIDKLYDRPEEVNTLDLDSTTYFEKATKILRRIVEASDEFNSAVSG